MKLNKKVTVRFGSYGQHPKDAEPRVMNFPEDTIFFTGGEGDIGGSLHQGALHVLAMTKASDKELKKVEKSAWAAHIVTADLYHDNNTFRVNGYAFIQLPDCILEGVEFTDADKVNELLDLKNHPVYVICLNADYMISNIVRIDRINSYYNVNNVLIQLYSQIGSRYYPMIHPYVNSSLQDIISVFHEFSIYIPEESYGKELFDELLYIALGHIYPEYNEKLIGYDVDYIHRAFERVCRTWKEMLKQLQDEHKIDDSGYMILDSHKPRLDNIKKFTEKLPLKNEK